MWKLIASSALAMMAVTSSAACASTAVAGKVSELIVNRAGMFFFVQSGQRTPPPACSQHDRWVIDARTDQGKAAMTIVVTAYAQGKLVTIFGTGACQDWPDTEGIDYVQVH